MVDTTTKHHNRPKRKYRSRARQRSPDTIKRAKRLRRGKANDRERKRMHSLNDALEGLRAVLPQIDDEPRMTKIETLRMAHNYIMTLAEMLKINDESSTNVDSMRSLFPESFTV